LHFPVPGAVVAKDGALELLLKTKYNGLTLCFSLLFFFFQFFSPVSPLFSMFFFLSYLSPPPPQNEDDGDKCMRRCSLNGSSLLCVFSFSFLC
jgi:hypothetical protein